MLLYPTEAAESDVQLFAGKDNVAAQKDFGEPIDESVWQAAAVVVEARYLQQLVSHMFMEARAILVRPEPDGALTVWVSHQAPHRLRRDLAAAFALRPERVRVIVPDVGGAFGGKSETWPEYLAVVAAARRLGRPVRWLEDRAESLTGPPHGRGQNQRVRMAADAEDASSPTSYTSTPTLVSVLRMCRRLPGVTTITAPDWAQGLSTSLRTGLTQAACMRADYAVVHVIDTPDVGAAVTARVLKRALASPSGLARAYFGNRPGHPVVLARASWPAVLADVTGDRGAGAHLGLRDDVERVSCGDLAVGRDIDDPA